MKVVFSFHCVLCTWQTLGPWKVNPTTCLIVTEWVHHIVRMTDIAQGRLLNISAWHLPWSNTSRNYSHVCCSRLSLQTESTHRSVCIVQFRAIGTVCIPWSIQAWVQKCAAYTGALWGILYNICVFCYSSQMTQSIIWMTSRHMLYFSLTYGLLIGHHPCQQRW